MRSKLLALGLLLGFLSSTCYVNAQKTTYEYKYLYTVGANGVKYTNYYRGNIQYITFKDNAKTLYLSDKDGYITGCQSYGGLDFYGSFQGENNGMRIYHEYAIYYDVYCNPKAPVYCDNYFYFSSDFSRLNYKQDKVTDVYERHILEHPKKMY